MESVLVYEALDGLLREGFRLELSCRDRGIRQADLFDAEMRRLTTGRSGSVLQSIGLLVVTSGMSRCSIDLPSLGVHPIDDPAVSYGRLDCWIHSHGCLEAFWDADAGQVCVRLFVFLYCTREQADVERLVECCPGAFLLHLEKNGKVDDRPVMKIVVTQSDPVGSVKSFSVFTRLEPSSQSVESCGRGETFLDALDRAFRVDALKVLPSE